MFIVNMVVVILFCASVFVAVRLFLYRSAPVFALRKWSDWIDDKLHVHQFFKVPQLNQNAQENQLYRKVSVYLNSLSSLEDSDFTNLVNCGAKSNDIVLCLDDNQVVQDQFLGARISWINRVEKGGVRSLVLRVKKRDKRRILRPYLQHIHTVSDNFGRELKLFMNRSPSSDDLNCGRWRSVPFTHPSSLDTVVMESDLKNRVKSDLETFLKSEQYYHKLGRVWRRSYLLYGPSGTGKSSFIAAMANFLNYDVYDIDLSRVSDDSDLKLLLLQTASKSVIVVEDVDRLIQEKKSMAVSFSGLLNFMDGIVNSCCGDEKIMVFTMNCKEQIDPAMLRPGRIDVHIHFPLCDFNSFKCLANNYLGVKEHKLFPQVEEIFQSGATLTPAEIGELMLVHRSSPSRAIKSVITALQTDGRHGGRWRRLTTETSSLAATPPRADDQGNASWKDTVPVAKEFRKLYGLLRLKSGKRSGPLDHDLESIQR